jgi:hypothetical protein
MLHTQRDELFRRDDSGRTQHRRLQICAGGFFIVILRCLISECCSPRCGFILQALQRISQEEASVRVLSEKGEGHSSWW